MRTTIDIDDALLRRLRDVAHAEGIPFRALLHRLLQRGLDEPPPRPTTRYRAPAISLGTVREGLDLAKAHAVVDALSDEEISREMIRRK